MAGRARRLGALALVPVVFAVGASQAGAGKGKTQKFDTGVEIQRVNGGATNGTAAGVVFSEGKCIANRRVDLYGVYPSGKRKLDRAYTSRNGAFGAHLTFEEYTSSSEIQVKVLKSVKRTKAGGKRVCKSAKATFDNMI